MLGDDGGEVFADITEGVESTLYAGQVLQVIGDNSGDVQSVVLQGARRYRRDRFAPIGKYGAPKLVRRGAWVKIGDSEAFYMAGAEIHNISYRVYRDAAKGKDRHLGGDDGKDWIVSEWLAEALSSTSDDNTQEATPASSK